MTIDSARQFLKKLQTDKSFVASLQNVDDDARREIIGKEGFDFTGEELDQVRSEITDDELSSIIGGLGGPLLEGSNAGKLRGQEEKSGFRQREKQGGLEERGE